MNMERIERLPVIRWAVVHPRIAAWIVLALGMVILLVIEAREVGLLPTQWLALIVACVLVAGACVWIISWEGDDDESELVEEATVVKTDDKVEHVGNVTVVTTDTPAEPPTA